MYKKIKKVSKEPLRRVVWITIEGVRHIQMNTFSRLIFSNTPPSPSQEGEHISKQILRIKTNREFSFSREFPIASNKLYRKKKPF